VKNFKINIKYRPFSSLTFEEAQFIYDEYKKTRLLPDGAEIINPKNCFPILEHNIVFTKLFDIVILTFDNFIFL
jgi:hypothetical protein